MSRPNTGAYGVSIAEQAVHRSKAGRHENFSRTVWTTFHWRGTTSSVSVTRQRVDNNREDVGRLNGVLRF
jgi:hypothetical protein